MRLSQTFLIRLKLNDQPAYRIAQQAGVNPNTLSRLINGIEPIKPGRQTDHCGWADPGSVGI